MNEEKEIWEDLLSTKLKEYSTQEIELTFSESLERLTGVKHTVRISEIKYDGRQAADVSLVISEVGDFESPF
ncbi:MAG: hypothetical protein K6L76_06555 [Agarilytica sp.]